VPLVGGAVALAVAAVVVVSVLRRWLFSQPIPGDFELAQIGTAVAVFAFLPYCQVVRGNIVVDTFTSGLPARVRGRIDALWDVVYAVAMPRRGLSARGTLDTFASRSRWCCDPVSRGLRSALRVPRSPRWRRRHLLRDKA
jgi:hypothetical protein